MAATSKTYRKLRFNFDWITKSIYFQLPKMLMYIPSSGSHKRGLQINFGKSSKFNEIIHNWINHYAECNDDTKLILKKLGFCNEM